MINYMGGARHTAKPEFSDPTPILKRPVASFSNPARNSQSWTSTGAITNSAGMRNRKRPGDGGSMGGLPEVDGPLDLDAHAAIIDASGLGQPGSDKPDTSDLRPDIQKAAQADERPASTGNPAANYDHPLLAKIRAQQAEHYAGVSSGTSKPRMKGSYGNDGSLTFNQIASGLGEPE